MGNKDPLAGLIRESSRQSENNRRQLEALEEYWRESPGAANAKLEAFAKYVTRESLTKFLARNEVFQKQLEVHGSIVECGVARGASLMTWLQLSAIYEPVDYLREVIGFDSFRGFPSVHEKDLQTGSKSEHSRIGGFAIEEGMREDIERAAEIADMTRFLGHIPKLELVEGDILETVPKYIAEHPHLVVSLLHLDVDLYEPTKFALEHFLPRMPKGAVVMFDELNMRAFPGETAAALETVGLKNLELRRFSYATCMSYAVL
jgi:hypothetical protein